VIENDTFTMEFRRQTFEQNSSNVISIPIIPY
jgi:hypothetical protein